MISAQVDQVLVTTRDDLLGLLREHPDDVDHYLNVHYARYRHDVTEILNLAPPGGRILDLGAAPFCTAETLARLGYDVVAGDAAPENWGIAGRLTAKVEKVDCDGQVLPFDKNSFDVVVLTEVFEHLHVNLVVTGREMRRVLKRGGHLYLTTPNGFGLRRLLKVLRQRRFQVVYDQWASIEKRGFCGHVTEYTPRELEDFFTKCGFKEVRVRTQNVYGKRSFENHAWRIITAPLSHMRENITVIARKG